MTLTELLIAATIMVMIVGAMSMLAMTVHSANDHCQGQSLAAQHGRVVIDRIVRSVSGATTSESFSGCLVITEQVGAWKFPDTLVVWLPTGTAADPNGLPRVGEIVLYTADPAQPNCLLEVRLPGSTQIVPAESDTAAWRTLAASLRTDPTAQRITLTDRVRTGVLVEQAGPLQAANMRACLRFHRLISPSEAEWAGYKAGTVHWDELTWPLDAYSSLAGTRRVVCQMELQIFPGDTSSSTTAVPFFGSAGITYHLNR